MKNILSFFKTKRGIICLVIAAVCLLAGTAAFGGYKYWLYLQPKFHDVTIELGTETLGIRDFTTKYANPDRARFVTDVTSVNLDEAGDITLVLAQGKKEETVTLHIVDTVAPAVEFITARTETIDYVPQPEDFVESVEDYAKTTIYFADMGEAEETKATSTDAEETEESRSAATDVSKTGGTEATATDVGMSLSGKTEMPADQILTVVVADASGNETSCECELHYEWICDSYSMELGTSLSREDLLLKADVGTELISDETLQEINTGGAGEYAIECTWGGRTDTCTVTVRDSTAPELTLQEVHIYENETATLESFIVSATDLSGEVELRLASDLPNGEVGIYTVTIEAEDKSGNITSQDTVFEVKADDIAPVISGVSDITVYEHAAVPDYAKGVTATDNIDGTLEVTIDASSVNMDTAGTYEVIYTAADRTGNVTEVIQRVTVLKDTEPPVFSGLYDLTKYQGTSAPNYSDGVTATDNVDGQVTWTYDASGVDMNTVGTYTITYTATDAEGNVATAKRKLTVKRDDVAPEISTLYNIYLVVGADPPDYAEGVTATDNIDGRVAVTFDAGNVDYDTPGIYYVTYTATDKTGNRATKNRKVTIKSSASEPDEYITVFAGDSITTGLYESAYDGISKIDIPGKKYVVAYKGLGTTTFRTRDVFDGMTGIEKVISYNPSRVYFMLGMNEVEWKEVSKMIEKYTVLLEELMESCPSVDIVILAVSPVSSSVAATRTGFQNIPALNDELEKMAVNLGLTFYDYTAEFKNSDGYLKSEYDGGDGIHWKKKGYMKFAELITAYDATLSWG